MCTGVEDAERPDLSHMLTPGVEPGRKAMPGPSELQGLREKRRVVTKGG